MRNSRITATEITMSVRDGENLPVSDMSELENPQAIEGFSLDSVKPEQGAVEHMPPIVAFGGLFTVPRYHFHYSKLTDRDDASVIPGRERFITPLNRGTGQIEAMRRDANERAKRIRDRVGENLYGVGHSLGGLILTWVAMDNPGMFAGVSLVAGAQEGIKKHTLATLGLRILAGNPAHAKLLDHDSGFMQEHLAQVEEEWPDDVPMDIISTSLDIVIVPPQGFGLHPRGQQPSKRLVVSNFHAVSPLTHRAMRDMPEDVKPLYTPKPVEHVFIVRSRTVLNHIDRRRAAIVKSHDPEFKAAS